ncbi:hypothetical protein [Streptomyces cucumeris]|uniref:hypothetical protein n=1 Tax=Streptomyces cucumeris TaxID=2962890 RepID=UPI0020C836A3|nr:hypothetical protein [Streptomyces sp. NEAU-Y11]MCP9208602.1 hypothetical protein [Streptomyces sp. NEAU-Y11]
MGGERPARDEPTRHGTTHDERELRALLERAVPRPGAPADRMLRVRERVLRRRRRQAAGLAGGAVAALTVINVVAPVRGGDEAVYRPNAAPRAAATAGTFRFAALAGMTVRLPDGWSGRALPVRPGRDPVGLAGTRPTAVSVSSASSRAAPCPDVQRYCVRRSALRPGEGLIVFRLQRGHMGEGGARAELMATGPGRSCRAAGGTRELTGWRPVEEGAGRAGDELVLASACLHRPSAVTLAQARSVLRTAVFPEP